MKQVIRQSVIALAVFLAVWLLVSRIPFTSIIDFRAINRAGEAQLGKFSLNLLEKTDKPILSDTIVNCLDSIKDRICKANGIDPGEVHIHPCYSTQVNAFTLPGGNIVIYSGLIVFCNNPEELAAVMAHEIGHIIHRHVMKKLSKELGISVVLVMAGGGAGSSVARDILKTVSSTAFDRRMEREADSTAVRYLIRSAIDPNHFADLLLRFAENEKNLPGGLEWISTHPESKGRAAAVQAMSKNIVKKELPVLNLNEWSRIQSILRFSY